MNKHECGIGFWGEYDNSYIISFSELLKEIESKQNLDDYTRELGLPIISKSYSISDYLDRRKNTNLELFYYCPFCGKEINLKELREKV